MEIATKYMLEINNCSEITVLVGTGLFLEYETGEVYEVESIKLPFTASGKHITVFNKDDFLKDTVKDFSYLDGRILEFKSSGVRHWSI